ncbi:MAG TPA: hypothetical protein DEA96_18560, partial [Leptospiraceae bacterium]|nr:hypothetical protein [Leptospiraceae bacterium]
CHWLISKTQTDAPGSIEPGVRKAKGLIRMDGAFSLWKGQKQTGKCQKKVRCPALSLLLW